jgi:hypothetical protein
VEKFVKTYAGQTAAQIRSDAAWQKAHAAKPKHVDKMTQAEKDNFKRLLDRLLKLKLAMMTKAVQARATLNPSWEMPTRNTPKLPCHCRMIW